MSNPYVEQQLDQWLIAKRSKDFATADAIRTELRAMGIDPDTERPRGWTGDVGCSGGGKGCGKSSMGNTDNSANDMQNQMMQMMQMMTQMAGSAEPAPKKQKVSAMPGMDDNMMQMMQMMGQMSGSTDSNPSQKQNVSGMSGFGAAQSGTGDDWTEQQLDKWLIAKRSKDFVTADAIRDELRAIGIDPDTARPRGGSAGGASAGNGRTGDAWVDEQLDKWLIAKRQKDFATADAIRDELRGMGIDPDTVRPRGWEHQAGNGNTGDLWTEQQLDKWVAAKRLKDFATADAIRTELRAIGIDPDTVRPADGSKGGGKSNMGTMGTADNNTAGMENNMMQMMQMMTSMMGMMNK